MQRASKDQQDQQEAESVNSLYSCSVGRGECACKVAILEKSVSRAHTLLALRRDGLRKLLLNLHTELGREKHKCQSLDELAGMVSTLTMLLI